MATDLNNSTEDTEMAECDEEKVVTMMDVLQEQEDFEEDANAVLGASDDKNCTYSKGYIKRQAIYACMTCCSEAKYDPNKRAGVCLACSLSCHENHELIELYTKRNFKCDCGNPKFNSHPCHFTPNKIDLNEDNSYNQNFSGVYCVCQRPYPDPESPTEVEMIQCIICEDWLHSSHLEATVPDNDQYSEMICKGCMEKNDFLHDYSNFAVETENVTDDVLTNRVEDVADDVLTNRVEDVADDVLTNRVEDDKNKLCNGDTKQDESDNSLNKDESMKAETDVEMTEESAELNISGSDHPEKNTDMKTDSEINTNQSTDTNKIDDKNEDIISKTKESIDAEKKSNAESSETTMETDLSKQIDANITSTLEIPTASDIDESYNCTENVDSETVNIKKDNIIEETIKDICQISENTENDDTDDQNASSNKENSTIDKLSDGETDGTKQNENEPTIAENDNESTIAENETEPKTTDNENKHLDSENAKEAENIEKSAEQIEEDRLLADPDDDIKKSNVIEKNVNDCNSNKNEDNNIQSAQSSKSETDKEIDNAVIEKSDTSQKANAKSEASTETAVNETSSNIDNNQIKSATDSANTELETISEKQDTVVEKTSEKSNYETSSSTEDKFKTEEIEMQDDNAVEENESKSEKVNTTVEPTSEGDGNVNSKVELLTNNGEPDVICNNMSSEKRKRSIEENIIEVKKQKLNETISEVCLRPTGTPRIYKGATFWPSTFRQKLCTCKECITMYKDLSVLFLIDPEDTVTAYENLGKQKFNGMPTTQYEKGLQALSSLDRIQQINALTEYNKMRDKLLLFLKSFKERKEVVKEEDIKEFFAGMKPKREPDGVYFCR